MRWRYVQGLALALLHILAAWLALLAGFAFVVRQTQNPGSILVVALFVSLPLLIQGLLAVYTGGYRTIPELGWILTLMLQGVGIVFLLFIFLN